tara:strand:+ start:3344 stop:3976 length:633 start_codon:yes stop_codon:yes gene_type:complete
MKRFKSHINEDIAVYKPQAELKPAKYKDIKIFKDGWQNIQLPPPPPERIEIDKVIEICHSASEKDIEEYKLCDTDASYMIKDYMDKNDLEYDSVNIEYIERQCVPIIRHYKNHYNRPRPYQVAAYYNKELRRFNTDTASTPAYPSGHTVQPLVVALHYAKKYPEHKSQLIKMANICGYGRVIAGLHYPSDFSSGVILANKLMEYIEHEKF